MDNEIILKELNGEITANSRDVAERFRKEHGSVLKSIDGENRKGKHINGLIDEILASGNPPTNYFKETSYINRGKSYKEYELTRDGFSLLVMGFTGVEATKWKLKYIEAFNKMESRLKEQNSKALPTSYKEALVQLLQQLEDNEKLLDEVDRYQRFLCEKTGCLTKSELAKKLDASAQTLAAKLKKIGVYTKTSQVSEEFLRKYPSVKIIIDKVDTYVDKESGEQKEKKDWQWTYEGSKILVDYLISIGLVTYTDNNGFKLNRQ